MESSMKIFIKPQNQYFLLPLTFVYICIVAVINYILCKNFKMAIKTLLQGFLSSIIIFLILPTIINSLGIGNVIEDKFKIIYIYLTSTLISIYFIKKQKVYLNSIK